MLKTHKFTHTWCGTHRTIQFSSLYIDKEDRKEKHELNSTQIQEIITTTKQMIDTFEQNYSRFLPESLVTRYNTGENILDPHLQEMISIGKHYHALSDGIFDVHLWGDLEKIGYGSVQYKDKKTRHLDLWWIGKGYLIRSIQCYFDCVHIDEYCINGGWDITLKQQEVGKRWPIHIQNPTDSQKSLWKITLLDWSFASSGTQWRTWWEEQQYHHLIDSNTHLPSKSPLLSVQTLHKDICIADIAATTLFVAPLSLTESIAQKLEVDYMLIFDDLSVIMSEWFQKSYW